MRGGSTTFSSLSRSLSLVSSLVKIDVFLVSHNDMSELHPDIYVAVIPYVNIPLVTLPTLEMSSPSISRSDLRYITSAIDPGSSNSFMVTHQ